MLRATVWVGATVLLAGCQPQSIVVRNTNGAEDGLHVTGTATVRATPTLVVIRLGCAYTDAGPSAVKAKTDGTIKKVIAAVRAAGLRPEAVQTQSYRLAPTYDSESRITTWHSSSMLEIRVNEPSKASGVLQAALDAGANRVEGIEYTIEELQELRSQARDQACKVAKEKAGQFAKNFGVPLGKPIRISESVPGGWAFSRNVATQNFSLDARSEAGSNPDSVLSSGSVAVDLTVDVTYTLG